MSAELSARLVRALESGIGFVQGMLVHAYTPAFHRIPRLHQRLGEAFCDSPEVLDVLAAVILLLEERCRLSAAARAGREAVVLAELVELRRLLEARGA